MKEILAGVPVETDNKTVRKSVSEAMERSEKRGVTKFQLCFNAVVGFSISKYLDTKAKSAVEIAAARSHSAKSVDDTSGIIQHPVLLGLKNGVILKPGRRNFRII